MNTPNDLTTTAQQVVIEANTPADPASKTDPKIKKRNDEFRSRIQLSKSYRQKLIPNWTMSIDYRRGKPFTSQSDEDQIAVNLDWTYTKSKHSALFSQVPQARIIHSPETLPKNLPWVSNYERALNDKLVESGIEACMEECLPDCINAAGIGVGMVTYEAITEDKQIPKFDTKMLPKALQDEIASKGTIGGDVQVPMESIPQALDHRYTIQRVSPSDLLWPNNFTGSNFNTAPWIGRSGRITWAEAVQKFNLKESDKESILGEDKTPNEQLTFDAEKDRDKADDMVGFDEIFYREFQFDPNCKSFNTIHHLVFITGKDEPVVDEPWKGQRVDPQDQTVIGVTKFPIQVLTLTYVTDESIPPSDSAIGRSQVNELNKGRTQQIKQRERSLPVRWFDVNRVDPAIQQGLMRGTWQAMIPIQGDGSRSIGEVARATMPTENFVFDKVAKADLQEQWAMGQAAKESEPEEKTDQNQNRSALNTQLGKERARVGSFFCALAEVLGGLMCLYENPANFGEGFDPKFSKVLKFSILTDSTVLLDAGQKLSRLNQFVNTYAKSGWVNIEPILQEIATLVGLDASIVIKAPEPKAPVEPNISLRLTGVEDMLNPLTLAFLIKSGQAPSPETIEQAKQLIQQSVVPPSSPGTIDPTQGPAPALPPPTGQAPPPGAPTPSPGPEKTGEAHPEWTTLTKLDKRTESGGKQ